MKKKIARIICSALCLALFAGVFAACGCKSTPVNPDNTDPPEPTDEPEVLSGYETAALIEIPTTPNAAKLDGLGVEWDPHFFRSTVSSNKKFATDENWNIVSERTKYLGIDKARVWCMPSWYEKRNDNKDPKVIDWESKALNFDSNDFKALRKELDLLQEAGVEVTLTLWGCEASYWLACRNTGDWVTAPNDIEEYAETVSILLQYLLNTCGYTCITGFTPMNEPNLAWRVDGGAIDQTHYISTCKAVDQRLKDDGIRDKIKLVLSDDSTNNHDWFKRNTIELKGIADSFAYHTYLFNETSDPQAMFDFAKDRYDLMNENSPGVPVTVNEFGSNYNVGAYIQTDVDNYDRGIYYSTIAEQYLSAGMSGMLHWCYFDVFYSNGEDFRMKLGLFKFADQGFATRPFYYSWGMIMKYTERGSDIFKVNVVERDSNGNVVANSGNLSAVAFRSPAGKWTYLVTNRSKTDPIKVQIVNQNAKTPDLKAHVYNEANVNARMGSEDEAMLIGADESAIEKIIGSSTFLELQPNTFVLITDME